MKSILLITAMFATVLFVSARVSTSADVPVEKLVAECSVIAYATAETNKLPEITFVITQIWKGPSDATAIGFTNGHRIKSNWPRDGGPVAEGEVLFVQTDPNSPTSYRVRRQYYVRGDHIGRLSLRDFRSKYGL